jgi:hypothetical protein
MTTPSHGTPGADPCCPPAATILQDEALLALGTSAEDAETAAHRIRFLTSAARIEHGLEPGEWLAPEQLARLQQLATLADQLAAGARALLVELRPPSVQR